MFSTVHAGLCKLVRIHLSRFSPSCQTRSSRKSSVAPYPREENPGRPYQCEESHLLWSPFRRCQKEKEKENGDLTQLQRASYLCELFLKLPRYVAPPVLQVPGERCGLTLPWRPSKTRKSWKNTVVLRIVSHELCNFWNAMGETTSATSQST